MLCYLFDFVSILALHTCTCSIYCRCYIFTCTGTCMYFVETNTMTPVVNTPEAEHGSLSSSSQSPVESPGSPVPASPVIDADLARMEALLDNWCLDLKRNVLVRNGLCCTMYMWNARIPMWVSDTIPA